MNTNSLTSKAAKALRRRDAVARLHGLLEHHYQGSSTLGIYARLYEGQWLRLILSALIFLVKHSPAVLLPVVTALVIDLLTSHAPLSQLWLYALFSFFLIAQNLPGNYLHVRLLSQAIRQVERDLRSAISHRLQLLSISHYQERSPAILQTKMLRDVESIEQMTRALVDGVLGSGSAILVAVVTTAIRAPQFLWLFLLTVPIAVLLILSTRATLAEHNKTFRSEVEGMSARVNEMAQLIPITRAHGLEQHALDRVEDTFERVSDAGVRLDSVNGLFGGMSWVCFQALNFSCLIIAAWVFHTQTLPITLGDVVMLSTFFSSLTSAMLGLAATFPQINKGLEAIRSIGEVLQSPDIELNEGKSIVSQVAGKVVFEQVGFSYARSAQAALSDITLQVEPGQTIALVGPSGSGKSTLINLVIGFIRPSSGKICFDGVDMQTLDLRSWRQFLSVVPQETVLFDGSIRDNILYGLGPVREEVLRQALSDANCLQFVANLPQGIDTLVGERGGQLSGGQRQRLAIARALVRNPHVLVLDEATGALDTESERQIQEALERLQHGRTTFVVAHRLSTVRRADQIVVMEQGRIVDVGPHAVLLERCPLYARLAQVSMA
ncbi:MAG: ABC transporter ATP-binding protein [Pseudomonadota bacterium]